MSEHEEHTPHIVSPLVYLYVYLALVAGVGLQVLASFHNLGIFNPILAVGIAVVQLVLVVLFSMHLKYSPRMSQLCVGAGIFMLATLWGLILLEYYSRAWGSW
ncbi:MAG TPA: cytochrome C oxidase subunit IV family protein [Terracidiphilus sp.]|nr:cytochrome C oxidase subunit IV family protein [Terracidiphilus sp.]